jgi:peptide/nickel transport system substrate-binding protein
MKIGGLVAILLAAGSFLVAARDNSIIYLRTTDAMDLDPWQAQEVYSTEIAFNIFEGLVRFRKNSTAVEPCLATSWAILDNGRRWIFTLRRGVRFHDGTPFDAQAVLYSFRRRQGKKQDIYEGLSFLISFITGIRSSDPYTVEITLERPYAPFLIALADSTAFIVSPSARKSGVFQPIGTGPFRFLSWAKGKSLILTRNPDYWAEPPRLDRIIFKVMHESQGRLLQIKNGSADMAEIQSGKEYEELSHNSDIAILRNPSISTYYLGFNTRRKPFDSREVRAAFLHIIDKGSMIKQIFQNMALPAYFPLPQPLFPELKVQPVNSFDLGAARALLKKVGLQEGFTCTLYFSEGQEGSLEVANLLTVMAKKIKITIHKFKLPFNMLMEAVDRGEHDMLLSGWSTSPDPDFFLYPLFTFSPDNRNRFFYENPELTRLLDRGKITLDPLQREKIYLEALAILKKDMPWIPLYHPLSIIVCNKKVKGLAFTPLGQAIFREVVKETK